MRVPSQYPRAVALACHLRVATVAFLSLWTATYLYVGLWVSDLFRDCGWGWVYVLSRGDKSFVGSVYRSLERGKCRGGDWLPGAQ
jgi:hypothetical protein